MNMLHCAGSEAKLEVCKRYGAHVAINYKTCDFAAEVLAATNNKGVRSTYMRLTVYCTAMYVCCLGADIVLDFIGASYWEKHMRCTAVDARIVHLGLVSVQT